MESRGGRNGIDIFRLLGEYYWFSVAYESIWALGVVTNMGLLVLRNYMTATSTCASSYSYYLYCNFCSPDSLA